MKIIHCSDIHLGSIGESRFPKVKAEERMDELRTAFNRMVKYAEENDVKVIMLCGDIFDAPRPLKKDKEFFYNVIRNSPRIDFLYVPGSGDCRESYTENVKNLKVIGKEWVTFDYGDVTISGLDVSADNTTSTYEALTLDEEKKNIVMMYGQLSAGVGNNKVCLRKLKDLNIDYLALGGEHSYQTGEVDGRGKYVYPGCLEGRLLSETGEKGFIVIDTDTDALDYKIVGNSVRVTSEYSFDLTDVPDRDAVIELINNKVSVRPEDIVVINVSGGTVFDSNEIDKYIERTLSPLYYFVSATDSTVRKYDMSAFDGDITLESEFIKAVMNNKAYTDEEKKQIISYGLLALGGSEIE